MTYTPHDEKMYVSWNHYLLEIDLLENYFHLKNSTKIEKVIKVRYDFLIISKLSQRFYDAETSERDPEFVKLLNNSSKIYMALSEGTLQQTKQLMAPHYTFHDKVSTFQIQKEFKIMWLTSVWWIYPVILEVL